jgi:hypothetical protein
VNSEGAEQVDDHPRAGVLSQRHVQDCSIRTCRTESAGLQAVRDSSLASFSCRGESTNHAGCNAATTRGRTDEVAPPAAVYWYSEENE